MKKLQVTKHFKKDIKRVEKQRKDIDKLKVVIETICDEKELEEQYRDHKLSGNYEVTNGTSNY